MRCYCCNVILTPQESTRKFTSGDFVDMCNKCFGTIEEDVEYEESDLEDVDDEEENR